MNKNVEEKNTNSAGYLVFWILVSLGLFILFVAKLGVDVCGLGGVCFSF